MSFKKSTGDASSAAPKAAAAPAPARPAKVAALPDITRDEDHSFEDFTYLIYGERKIGKTSLFSKFKDPFFLFFEPGGLSITGVKKVNVPDWPTFLEYVALLEKNPSYCQTVVIDTGYMAYERCFEFCLKRMGITTPQDKSWGTGWKFIDREFREAHHRLLNAGIPFGVTAHSEIREVQRRDGSKYDKLMTQLGGQAHRLYAALVDVHAYFQYDKHGARILTIRGDSHIEAGCRMDKHFIDSVTKQPLTDIPMGKNANEAYKNLQLAFANKLAVKA